MENHPNRPEEAGYQRFGGLPLMTRLFVLWAAAWVLLASPALCVGGVLSHFCACEAESCGHEDACAADPCPDVMRAVDAPNLRVGAEMVVCPQLPSEFLLEHLLPRVVLAPTEPWVPIVEHQFLQRLRPLLI
jgi:hypothetical protein